MQCQLFCSKRNYCDFVLWTNKDLHIERIFPDDKFWLTCVDSVKLFFETSILVELLGKFYTRTSKQTISTPSQEASCSEASSDTRNVEEDLVDGESNDISEQLYCYCQGPEEGEMVGCDNNSCLYKWFHLSCLKLKSLPQSKFWYCPDCRKLPKLKKRKKQ